MKNLLLLLFLCPLMSLGEEKKIMVEGNSSNLYITHTTAPKENFYSIGRLYNISPRVYAPYNGLSVDAPGGLAIGQPVKIPLNELNFSQDGKAEPGEVFVPLYYRTGAKSSLASISSLFRNVPVENLQAWNRLSGDNVFAGSTIIVGYLKVKSDLSPLAKSAVAVPKSDVASLPKSEKISEQAKTVKEEPKKEVTVKPEPKKEEPKTEIVKKAEPVEPKKEEPKTDVVKKPEPTVTYTRPAGGGKFKDVFSNQSNGKKVKEVPVSAATFKSTSGWSDGKYYCFHNTALAGSIVKITNPASNKTVYAKVLDVIPDISQNDGIDLRLSNAAAEELGVTGEKFECVLAY